MRPARGAPGGRPPSLAPGALRGRLSLARALSKFGVCSRKEAERRIEAGRVTVDGEVVRWPARRIDPRHDRVRVDGAAVGDLRERVVLALHKPKDVLTTATDPAGRRTVYDLLGDVSRWVFPVGRLDRDTSGLLILTNDHQLGHRLTDPEHHLPKRYHARVRGVPDAETLRALREGVDLGRGEVTRPARVRSLGLDRSGGSWLEIILTEGRNRQVRRMCANVGHDVLELARVQIGRLPLGDLASGEWRRLTAAEVASLVASP